MDWRPWDTGRVQWAVCLRSGKLVSSCQKGTELEGPLAHLGQAPDVMGPEGLRNLPKLTQQADTGWLFQETVYWLA